MAKTFEKAVTGFNHNIKHKGKMYHVQTEDSGVSNPHIITHLFVGGNIVASQKTSYSDIIGAEDLQRVVRGMMEEQHKQMLRNLIRGGYDSIEVNAKHYEPGELAPQAQGQAEGATPPKAPSKPPPLPRESKPRAAAAPAASAGPSFGDGLISDRSLDEVILTFLSASLPKR